MKNTMARIKKNNKGFTLVELIVVIAVLAIITVVVAPMYLSYVEKSRIGTDENTIGEIAHIAEIAWVEEKVANPELGGVTVTITTTDGTISATDQKVADEINKVIPAGQYKFKSTQYTKTQTSVKITLDENGIASWSKADGTPMGGKK